MEDQKRLDRIRFLPTQFQKFIEGDDIRVHVVGEQTFACRIKSTVTDYRYATVQGGEVIYSEFQLPKDIHERCLSVSKALGLPLCGIDLKETKDNQYVCFEANPSPAFSVYEGWTGQPIAEAIVHALSDRS